MTSIARFLSAALTAAALLLGASAVLPGTAAAQQSPSYSFVSFDRGYDAILASARADGYQVKEEDINSSYGSRLLLIEKTLDFYTERLYLFFSAENSLISFTVEYTVEEGRSWTVLDKLIASITEKLEEKYGPNDLYPYYRVVESEYELFVRPHQSFSPTARVSFRNLVRTAEYDAYYRQEIEKLERREIEKTVEKY
jgi:hypothetical protein